MKSLCPKANGHLGAKRLAAQIGSNHMDTNIDKAVNANIEIVADALDGFEPQFAVNGGTTSENLALQNIQARSRMVFSYALSQVMTTAKRMPRAGASLLVLASTNVDGQFPTLRTRTMCHANPPQSIFGDT